MSKFVARQIDWRSRSQISRYRTLIPLDVPSLLSLVNEPELREDEVWMRHRHGLTKVLAVTSHAIATPVNQNSNVTCLFSAAPLKTRVHARGLTQNFEASGLSAAF